MANPMRMRIAQTELLGFAMVVFLIAVGLMIVVGYLVLGARGPDLRFFDKQVGVYLMQSIYHTTTLCRNMEVSQLLTNCVESADVECAAGDDGSGGTLYQNSCDYLNQTVFPYLLNETLGKANYEYRYAVYWVRRPGASSVIKETFFEHNNISRDCANIVTTTTILPIIQDRYPQMELDICGR